MAYSEGIKDYAKEKWLKPGLNGEHKFKNSKISRLIRDNFPSEKSYPDQSTIARWAVTPDDLGDTWQDVWDEGIRNGLRDLEIERTKFELEKAESTSEEEIRDQVSAITLLRATTAIKIYQQVNKFLDGKNDKIMPDDEGDYPFIVESPFDASRMLKSAETIFNNMNLESLSDPKKSQMTPQEKAMEVEEYGNIFLKLATKQLRDSKQSKSVDD